MSVTICQSLKKIKLNWKLNKWKSSWVMYKLETSNRVPGVCAKYPALRQVRSSEVGDLSGESRRENRCDKRSTNTSGTHIDIVHGTSGAIG